MAPYELLIDRAGNAVWEMLVEISESDWVGPKHWLSASQEIYREGAFIKMWLRVVCQCV